MTAPVLFDRRLVLARLAAAPARVPAAGPPDFLIARALDDLDERLATLARRFERGAALADRDGAVAARLAASGRIGAVVAMRPLAATTTPPGAAPPDAAMTVVGDEERLPFAPASLDFAASVLSLQAASDLPGALVQIRRALKPDGLFLAALAGGDTLTELRQSLLAAEAEIAGGAAPRVAPFVDVRGLGALMQRAGFALVVTDTDRVTVRYASLAALVADLRALGATNPLAGERRPLRRAVVARAAAIYAERFADPDGRLRVTVDLLSASGWAPAASQPRPARPGSATVDLADALRAIAAERRDGDDAGGG